MYLSIYMIVRSKLSAVKRVYLQSFVNSLAMDIEGGQFEVKMERKREVYWEAISEKSSVAMRISCLTLRFEQKSLCIE